MGSSTSMCGAPSTTSPSITLEHVSTPTGNAAAGPIHVSSNQLPKELGVQKRHSIGGVADRRSSGGTIDMKRPSTTEAKSQDHQRHSLGDIRQMRPPPLGACEVKSPKNGSGTPDGLSVLPQRVSTSSRISEPRAPAPLEPLLPSVKKANPAEEFTKGKLSSPLGGGLASRRNFKGAALAVENNNPKKNQVVSTSKRKRIRVIDNLHSLYEIGREVMPSCHSGMKVLFGKQKKSGVSVVIKVRQKRQSFKEGEEKEWRVSTEFMLNLPPSGNIARLYEVLEDASNYYVIMEECKGQDLFECLHSSSKLEVEEVKEVLVQILDALADLHAEGIIHKDLKLENVMLDRTPPSSAGSIKKVWSDIPEMQRGVSGASGNLSPIVAKIVDFDTVEEYQPATPKKTKDVLGTDQYIAQEAYAGSYSFASDVFAVGVIGYRLLVGKFPFDPRMFDDEPGENWVGSPKMKEIRKKLQSYKINWQHEVLLKQPAAVDLFKGMLATDERARPTAKEASQHSWLRTSRSSSHSGNGSPGSINQSAPLPNCVREEKSPHR